MKIKLCIVHWMPVEDFPPTMNIAAQFADKDEWAVSLCTNKNHRGRKEFSHSSLHVLRGTFPSGIRGIKRIWAYLSFHITAFTHLIKKRPDIILYFESHSALPVFLSHLFMSRASIFIHYHEYNSQEEYKKPGMRLARICNKIEKLFLYSRARWISQTNESRLKLFLADQPAIDRSCTSLLPNYPPLAWWGEENRAWREVRTGREAIRMVYVGALSRAETFIGDVVESVKKQPIENITLDIYSYNLHEETRSFLKESANEQIRFHEAGVNYNDLPSLLSGFHVGLILYKGNTQNYVHNATNKLFEYMACGLDVIFPKQMEGVKPYATKTSKPRVIECDFDGLKGFTFNLEGRQGLPSANVIYNCETELDRLEKAMMDSL